MSGWTPFTSKPRLSVTQPLWASRDIQIAALQQQARDWWSTERAKFDVVTSQVTLNEAAAGNTSAAAERLKLLDGLPLLDIDPEAQSLADRLIAAHTMPEKARVDALHVAVAAMGNVKYLLTLNCKHIANAHELPRMYKILRDEGFDDLLICTPSEFLGGHDDETTNS